MVEVATVLSSYMLKPHHQPLSPSTGRRDGAVTGRPCRHGDYPKFYEAVPQERMIVLKRSTVSPISECSQSFLQTRVNPPDLAQSDRDSPSEVMGNQLRAYPGEHNPGGLVKQGGVRQGVSAGACGGSGKATRTPRGSLDDFRYAHR